MNVRKVNGDHKGGDLTLTDILALLKSDIEKAGSRRKWSLQHGVTVGYVTDVLMGKRPPADAICRALNIEREIITTVHYKRRK